MPSRKVKTRLASTFTVRSRATRLAVLAHAYNSSPEHLAGVLKSKRPEWQRTTGFLAYLWAVWKVVTRV